MPRFDISPSQDHSVNKSRRHVPYYLALALLLVASAAVLMMRPVVVHGSPLAVDPGPRPLPADAGNFYSNLTPNQSAITQRLTQIFTEVNFVAGGPLVKTVGLGPRFNSNSCNSCHAYPAVGGSSPPNNPLFGIYQLQGATNTMPYFITPTGPVIVARFPYKSDGVTPDGGVHQMFTISNRTDAPGCTTMVQPNFNQAQQNNDIIFRQVTPTLWHGIDGTDPGERHRRQHEFQPHAETVAGDFGASTTTATMTARSPGLAGRRRTSLCSISRARRTR